METPITEIIKNRSNAEMSNLKASFVGMCLRDAAQNPELYIEGDQIENSLDVLYILEHVLDIIKENEIGDEEE